MLFNYMPYLYLAKEGEGGGTGSSESENKEGAASTATVDWSKVKASDIPFDLLKQSKAYVDVKNEAIDNRKKVTPLMKQIADLQAGLSKLGDEEATDATTKEAVKPNADGTPDFQKLINTALEAALKPITDQFNTISSERLETWQKQAGDATGIKSKAILATLSGKSFQEVLTAAKTIATEQGIPTPSSQRSIGNPAGERSKTALENAKAIMTGNVAARVYDRNVHKELGGGFDEED